MLGEKRYREAHAYCRSALEQDPDCADAFFLLGIINYEHNQFERALKLFELASPHDPVNFFNLGSSLQFVGDFKGAKEAYRTCLELAPQYIPARAHLALISKHSTEQNGLQELETAWQQRHARDIEGGLQLAHAIAKVHEDLGDPHAAMVWLDRGKALVRQHIPGRQAQDRILSSHSSIVSAGERPEFGALFHRAVEKIGPDALNDRGTPHAPEINLLEVGENYIESVQAILNSTQRFTDKMPTNAFHVPAILAALPNARVICLRRNPADSVLSIYRQLFALSALHYRCAHSLEDLAQYVVCFHDVVQTYKRQLPPSRFTLVDYETLVEDPNGEIRRLLEFSGLEFEQACLDFQDNSAPVGTASLAQVRQPIYRSSVDRWKRYQSELEPALEVLRKAGRL